MEYHKASRAFARLHTLTQASAAPAPMDIGGVWHKTQTKTARTSKEKEKASTKANITKERATAAAATKKTTLITTQVTTKAKDSRVHKGKGKRKTQRKGIQQRSKRENNNEHLLQMWTTGTLR